jgi:flagellar protein FlbC
LSLDLHSDIQSLKFFDYLNKNENQEQYSEINTDFRFDELYNSKIENNTENTENTVIDKEDKEQLPEEPVEDRRDENSIQDKKEAPEERTEEKKVQKAKSQKPETVKQICKEEAPVSESKENSRLKIEINHKSSENENLPVKVELHKESKKAKSEERTDPEKESFKELKIENLILKKDEEIFLNDAPEKEIRHVNKTANKNNKNTNIVKDNLNVSEIKNRLNTENSKNPVKVVVIDTRTEKPEPQVENINTPKNKYKEQDINLVKSESTADSKNNEIEIIQKVSVNSVNKNTQSEFLSNRKVSYNTISLQRFSEIIKSEVVKNTGMILRDNGKGEIKLILKPESLGNVRIKVLLDNNNIEGRIIVENNNIKQMFQSSMNELEQAFREEGFESASLEVSVSGQGSYNRESEDKELYRERLAENYEKNLSVVNEYITDESYINMVV